MYGTMEEELNTPPIEEKQKDWEQPQQTQQPQQQQQPQQKEEAPNHDPHYDPHFPYGEEGGEGEEGGGEEGKGGEEGYPLRELEFWKVKFNPVTSFLSVGVLLGMVVFCVVDPSVALEEMVLAKTWCTRTFCWLYIGTQAAWGLFLLGLFVRFRDLKLGKSGEEPEFSSLSYFTMLFCAGISNGMLYYGVAEPMFHQTSNRFANVKYHSEDEVDLYAINLTIFHWGWGGWFVYVTAGLCCSMASYRFDLPLTMRSNFYFLLGPYVWGWIGDLLDSLSIITVISGVCTSLGLGAFQIVKGLQRVGVLEGGEDSTVAYIVTVWVVTLTATASVLSGLGKGIRVLSLTGFGMAFSLWFMVFLMDDTVFLLNLFVEEIGYYFQNVIHLHIRTDAFAQLPPGSGHSTDGLSADREWQDSWTVFYWSWWTAWSLFVGLFIAKISRGRTIGSVMGFTLVAPLIYTFMWFTVFGGSGLRGQRRAVEVQRLGELLNTSYQTEGSVDCWDPPDRTVYTNTTTGAIIYNEEGWYDGYDGVPGVELVYRNSEVWVGPVCVLGEDVDNAWFNVLFMYGDWGRVLSTWSLVCIFVYFVTSADSGSLIVDHIAANGGEDHHGVQRAFWTFIEGGMATGLLYAGGKDALEALQAASIVAALPNTILVCFMCVSLWRMCDCAERLRKEKGKEVKGGEVVVGFEGSKEEDESLSSSSSIDPSSPSLYAARFSGSSSRFGKLADSIEQKQEQQLPEIILPPQEDLPSQEGLPPLHEIMTSFDVPIQGGVLNAFEYLFSGFNLFPNPSRAKIMPFPSSSLLLFFFFSLFCPYLALYSYLSRKAPHKFVSNVVTCVVMGGLFLTSLGLFLAFLIVSSPPFCAFSVVFYTGFAGALAVERLKAREEWGVSGSVIEDVMACFVLYPQVLVQLRAQLGWEDV